MTPKHGKYILERGLRYSMTAMKMEQRLSMTQTQKLILTQKIMQALKILQLPSMELENMITRELTENPLLEVSQGEPEQRKEAEKISEDSTDWEDEPLRSDSKESDPLDILKQIDEHSGVSQSQSFKSEDDYWFPEVENKLSFSEHLLHQIYAMELSPKLEEAAIYVIYSLDRHGLLSQPEYRLALGWEDDPEFLAKGVEIVRSLEPEGVGSSTVIMSLQTQLRNRGYAEDSLEYKIVTDYFLDMAEKRIKRISVALHCKPKEIQDAIDSITKLNPWPGSGFTLDVNSVVIPDIIIRRLGDRFVATLNDTRFPTLSISRRNRQILESPRTSDVEKEYITKKYQRAAWFIKSISQRQDTISRIGSFLAEYQHNFFEHGVEELKPLKLQTVADKLNLNQSTISRASNGKYLQSPQGIHELKYFFSRALLSNGGELSNRSVKDELRKLIDSEEKGDPMSDSKLAIALQNSGIEIKRRTVANYRSQMGIPSAAKRKRY